MSLNSGIRQLARKLQAGEISAFSLAQERLQQARQMQDAYNLFTNINEEYTLAQAKETDVLLGKGGSSPLTGIPYALKDIFCVRGQLSTCASKMLSTFVSPYDASVVERLNTAGAVMIGKTNMDEFAMGSSTEQSYYGPAINPWDVTRVPGGSSGGSAIAVASGLVPYALGSDTGGSVRQPAAFCGVCGIKPTYGRISRYGIISFASSLDQAGVFARSAEDIAFVLQQLCGLDTRDSTSAHQEVPDWVSALENVNQSLKGVTLGVAPQFMDSLDDDMRKVLQQGIDTLTDMGATLVEVQLPRIHEAIGCYYTVALAEASSNLSRYDGVRYGRRAEDITNLQDLYTRSRSEGFGDEVKRRILLGTYVLTSGYYDAYYRKAQQVRRLIRDDFIKAFGQIDVFVGPVTADVAFVRKEKPDPLQLYKQDIFTVPANLAGLPGMSVPMGFIDGLPVGMQLLAPHYAEENILRVAHAYQQVTNWHTYTPPAP